MYLKRTVTVDVERAATEEPPMGPGFPLAEAVGADRMEIWATTMKEEPERCEFRLFKGQTFLGSRTILGY